MLTHTESIILQSLLLNVGKMVRYDELANTVWGDTYPLASKALTVYVRRLRKKIEKDPSHPQAILNKTGVGYILKPVS